MTPTKINQTNSKEKDQIDQESKTEFQTTNQDSSIQPSIANDTDKKKDSAVKVFLRYVKLFFSWNVIHMSISHHPECEVFDEHVFKIGKLRICRGCTLSYPPLYGIVLIFVFWLDARRFLLIDSFLIPNLWWFTIGFFIVAILALVLRKYSIYISDIYKFSRGAFSGFLLIVILSQHWAFKIGAGIAFMAGMGWLSIKRGKEMEKTCDECEWHSNYDICPGWRNITGEFNKLRLGDDYQPPLPLTHPPTEEIVDMQSEDALSESEEKPMH